MFDQSATPTRKKSPEIVELERLYNSDTIRNHRDIDPRFTRPRRFHDHTDTELIFSILAYLTLLGGTANKSQSFRGVEGQFRGYSLNIKVDVSRPGKPSFNEDRETISMTVNSFAQFKNLIDEL